jgi:CDK-activating kinase assembly factor MAT1
LRRVNFRLQLFEDPSVDKEIEIRRRVLRDFNKTEEDFTSAREFGDYQELIEDIIYNLANNIEVQETNRQIADYKEANKNFINKNRQKNNREMLELEDILSEEKKQSLARRQLDLRLDKVSQPFGA